MITEDMIQEAINKCEWKKTVYDVDICRGMAGPCLKVIDNGQCDVIHTLVQKDKELNND